ncbi:uncharacterized protein LOC129801748 [Phlebotomus papatasi]|uniref:uncharacterized protein LOC129801748 n=1 Tax=Phlebotomus papatasi TaxID=29031 RepID=UPI0024844FBD|nr:uncharacterized protein LOC129801748 [Phlebotomus papatasi]
MLLTIPTLSASPLAVPPQQQPSVLPPGRTHAPAPPWPPPKEPHANPDNRTATNSATNCSSICHKHNSPTLETQGAPQRHDATLHRNDLHANNALRIAIVVVLLVGAAVLTFFGIVCCLRATQRASRALALPIPLLPDDQTPLNAEPEHPVPMLSVQSPGCAGMERLGVPARNSLNSPSVHDERNHISRRMRVDAIQARDPHQHQNVIRCPHHVALGGDSEWGADRDLHIRAPYQTEITRTYIRPPPNKTALDVPDTSYPAAFSQRSGSSGSSTKPSKSRTFKFFWRGNDSPSRAASIAPAAPSPSLPPPASHCHTGSRPAIDTAPNIMENGQHI